MSERRSCLHVPLLDNGETLDLHKLYHAVRLRGGFDKVNRLKLWPQISIDIPLEQRNSLSHFYFAYLYAYECANNFKGGNRLSELSLVALDSSDGCNDTKRENLKNKRKVGSRKSKKNTIFSIRFEIFIF